MKYDNTTRALRSADNKRKILDAAFAIMEERGFDGVSVGDITAAAGVSKGAFYIHFESKEDLVDEMINLRFDPIKSRFSSGGAVERVAGFLRESVAEIESAGLKVAQKWFSDSVRSTAYGRKKLKYDEDCVREILCDFYDSAAAEAKAGSIAAFYYGILVLWCFTDGEKSAKDGIEEFNAELLPKILA